LKKLRANSPTEEDRGVDFLAAWLDKRRILGFGCPG